MPFDYPPDLARYTAAHWNQPNRLPPQSRLTELFSCCYQASLLTEELHPVLFRLALVEPIDSPQGPPWGHHCLRFAQSRPFTPAALAKLSPTVDSERSVIGVNLSESGFEIWGIINSGARWALSQYSRRLPAQALADSLAIAVTAPGCLSVYAGSRLIAHLIGGKITGPTPEVLSSQWLEQVFLKVRYELEDLHVAACQNCPPVQIDVKITRSLSQATLRRALNLLRKWGHGGSLLIIPAEQSHLFEAENPFLHLQHRFVDSQSRRLYRSLLTQLMRRLGELFPESNRVEWEDYRASQDSQLSELDEAFEEFSYTLAGLLAMDGAVLMTQGLELLAFGAEIAGNLPAVKEVEVALDIEAAATRTESTLGVGTRHRSVYRLCAQLPWLLALVQSQDGRIRMVKQYNGNVTYWDQFGVGTGIPS
ncbi:hypothetical protein JST97_22215 [bacterium]|nr:hypothetical protein [bacterium]